MNSTEKNFESEFEIKIDNNMNGKELKLVIQKLSISIWNRLCEENKNQQMKIHQDQNMQLAQRLYVLTSIHVFRFDRDATSQINHSDYKINETFLH